MTHDCEVGVDSRDFSCGEVEDSMEFRVFEQEDWVQNGLAIEVGLGEDGAVWLGLGDLEE